MQKNVYLCTEKWERVLVINVIVTLSNNLITFKPMWRWDITAKSIMKKFCILLAAAFACSLVKASDELLILEEGSPAFWEETGKLATLSIDWSNTIVVEWGSKNKVKENLGTIDQRNRIKGEDYVRDWPSVQQTVLSGAAIMANQKNKKKGIKIIDPSSPTVLASMQNMAEDQKAALKKDLAKGEKKGVIYRDYSEAAYDIIISIDSIDMGSAAASAFGGGLATRYVGGADLVGSMVVRDRATKQLVCKLHLNHVKGIGNYGETARMNMAFFRLWTDAMPSLIKQLNKKK